MGGAEGQGPLGRGGHSPHVGEELLEPLLPMHRPELEPGCGVARVTQAVVEGPVLVERQAEAGASQGGCGLAAPRSWQRMAPPILGQPVITRVTWCSLTFLA